MGALVSISEWMWPERQDSGYSRFFFLFENGHMIEKFDGTIRVRIMPSAEPTNDAWERIWARS